MKKETKRVSRGRLAREAKASVVDELLGSIKSQVKKILKSRKRVQVLQNRRERRKPLQDKAGAMRIAQRTQRFLKLKEEAAAIKKRFPVNYKKQLQWNAIENEMKKLLGHKGESNFTPPKKKR